MMYDYSEKEEAFVVTFGSYEIFEKRNAEYKPHKSTRFLPTPILQMANSI